MSRLTSCSCYAAATAAWRGVVVTRSPRGTRRGRLPGKEGSVSGGRRGGQAPLRMLHKRHHRRLRGNDDVDPSFNEELRVAAAEYHHVGTGVGRPRGPTHTRPLGSPAAPTTVHLHHSRSNRARKALLPHHRYAPGLPPNSVVMLSGLSLPAVAHTTGWRSAFAVPLLRPRLDWMRSRKDWHEAFGPDQRRAGEGGGAGEPCGSRRVGPHGGRPRGSAPGAALPGGA